MVLLFILLSSPQLQVSTSGIGPSFCSSEGSRNVQPSSHSCPYIPPFLFQLNNTPSLSCTFSLPIRHPSTLWYELFMCPLSAVTMICNHFFSAQFPMALCPLPPIPCPYYL